MRAILIPCMATALAVCGPAHATAPAEAVPVSLRGTLTTDLLVPATGPVTGPVNGPAPVPARMARTVRTERAPRASAAMRQASDLELAGGRVPLAAANAPDMTAHLPPTAPQMTPEYIEARTVTTPARPAPTPNTLAASRPRTEFLSWEGRNNW